MIQSVLNYGQNVTGKAFADVVIQLVLNKSFIRLGSYDDFTVNTIFKTVIVLKSH